jgi:hypothetical protein
LLPGAVAGREITGTIPGAGYYETGILDIGYTPKVASPYDDSNRLGPCTRRTYLITAVAGGLIARSAWHTDSSKPRQRRQI